MNKKFMAVLTAGAMLFMTACSTAETEASATSESVAATTEATTTTTTSAASVAATLEAQGESYDVAGDYACERAAISVDVDEKGNCSVTVVWGDSAFSEAVWTMSGEYDAENNCIAYTDGENYLVTYAEDGSIESEEDISSDGTGVFYYNEDGTLTWQDDVNNQADGMVFEKVDIIEDAVG
ncbi:MAG: hypothetical protein K5745_04180 [Saccharofermentans sp.]|nr:hypothetical protein [Saccharofermentans sp.]